jgi:hypothetical protein
VKTTGPTVRSFADRVNTLFWCKYKENEILALSRPLCYKAKYRQKSPRAPIKCCSSNHNNDQIRGCV